MTIRKLILELKKEKDLSRAQNESRYFKTKKGEYGEGDIFWGVPTDQKRKLAKKYRNLPLKEMKKLLTSPVHDQRFIALVILTTKYSKADQKEKEKIFKFYLKHTKYINNWDLVDISAPRIIGAHLLDKNRSLLFKLAKSKNLWERRISIIATFSFIKEDQLKDTLEISKILLVDEHDLIHKAAGWALREVGKKDLTALESFLDKHALNMPRTMLRYSIEKMSEKKRQYYLNLGNK
ncbi:MAG: DNA alkylation repair protein [Candidatus Shapirobacteria bacterium]